MLVSYFSERKITYTDHYDESILISVATPQSQLRRHGSHSSGRLISLSHVCCSTLPLSKSGQLVQKWLPPGDSPQICSKGH